MIEQLAGKGYEPDSNLRNCADCRHMKAAVSWWCTNPEAVRVRGTQVPGVIHCPYWEAIRPVEQVSKVKRIFFPFNYLIIRKKK